MKREGIMEKGKMESENKYETCETISDSAECYAGL